MAKIGKRRARDVARAFAAELLRTQDMPELPVDRGLIDAEDGEAQTEFLEELRRIADRISTGITDPELLEAVSPAGARLMRRDGDEDDGISRKP